MTVRFGQWSGFCSPRWCCSARPRLRTRASGRRARRAGRRPGRRPTSRASGPRRPGPAASGSRCARRELSELYYPDLSHPSARSLDFMVDGRRVATGAVTQDTLTYTQTSSTSKWRLDPHLRDRPGALGRAGQGPLRVARRRRPRRRGRVRPAALQRRLRRRRLDARARAALARQPDRLGARRPPGADPHELGLQGPHGRPARAHLRRAAARQRRPAGPHAPDRARRAPRPDAGDRLRHGRHRRAGGRHRLARRRLRGRRVRLQGRLGRSTATSSSRRPRPRSRCWPNTRRRCSSSRPTRTRTTRARSWRRRACRGAGASCGSTPTTRARRPTTSSGRATSTRSPPRCWPRATRARPTRALDFLFDEQQLDDGSFPQNSQVDGTPKWKGVQMDQVALPIVLAWQLGAPARATGATSARRPTSSSTNGPISEQERWENQEGYSPGDDRGRDRRARVRGRDRARQRRRRARHDLPQARPTPGPSNVQRWTATTNGPYSDDSVLPAPDQGPQDPDKARPSTRSATPGPRTSTSAASWTRASSSWSGSASSAPTTR